MQQKLTAAALRKLPAPTIGVRELWDDVARGLCLRIFPSGKATWSFRYRPASGAARRRIALGEFPGVGLAEARKRATRHRGAVSGGADPQAERHADRAAIKLTELIQKYLREEVEPKKKAATLAIYKSHLERLIPVSITSKRAAAVTRADVARLHRVLGADTPVTANRVVVTLSGVFTFGGRHGYTPEGHNPCRGVERFREEGRERYLTTTELGRLGQSLRIAETCGLPWEERSRSKHDRKVENRSTIFAPHVSAAFRLLLFTGCRLREILGLKWTEIDFDRGLLLLSDSKTGRKPVILNALSLQILNELPRLGDYVIVGDDPERPRSDMKKPWDALRRHAELGSVRIHDLRHTFAASGAGAGLGLPIIGRLLGHRHTATTAKYAHLDSDPLRRASNAIGKSLAGSLSAT